jgi:FAD/FMN-containing dehydrogenase
MHSTTSTQAELWSEQALVDVLSGVVSDDIILRSNQVVALDPGWDADNTGAGVAVRPRNTGEVSSVLEACNKRCIPVVTHGGRTGLAGGAISVQGQVIMLTDRLEGGIDIDPVERVAVVSTAVTQQALQEAAAEHGLSMGIDTASRGSATIGGMISTNAGGMEAFRNGMMRERLLGIEAVLADGSVVSDLTRVTKANEGYDLKQLFCGAEGTLGVVTRAVLKLEAAEPPSNTTLLALPGAACAVRVMRAVQQSGGLLLCEVMWHNYARKVAEATGLMKVLSFCDDAPVYLVVESALAEDQLLELLEPFFESGDVLDAVMAKSKTESADIWRIREDSQAAFRQLKHPLLFDISVPLSKLDAYMTGLQEQIDSIDSSIELQALAHLGDGNLHLTFGREQAWSDSEEAAIGLAVEQGVKEMGGAVSAEHGIGLSKLDIFHRNAPAANLKAMAAIKAALDPNGVLNPGKVLGG